MERIVWTAQELSEALSIECRADFVGGELKFNSQSINKGDIFIALPGAQKDGHQFVEDALARGAAFAIVSRETENTDNKNLLFVPNTLAALDTMARYKRQKSKAKIIAITGSVGKTTTKQALQQVLQHYGPSYASPASFNNQLGVKLTLASIADDFEYVIVEMGMNKVGEINALVELAQPHVALITQIAEGHIGFFDSVEGIADAKCEIFNELDSQHGVAILNSDMELFPRCKNYLVDKSISNVLTFGASSDDIRIIKHQNEDSIRHTYSTKNEEIGINTTSFAPHMSSVFGGVIAVIKALSLAVDRRLIDSLSSFSPQVGRGKLVETESAGRSYKVICDYYNSNPKSLGAAFEYLKILHDSEKVAIIGDMKELGQFELELHRKLVPSIQKSGVKKIFLIGEIMPLLVDDFHDIEVHKFSDAEQVVDDIDNLLEGGELILIKGSRSMKLERVAKKLGVKDVL